ncbi:MAG: damage-control phosphatase ARMT1 family protein [Spirochaetota bacterium]
MPCHVNHIYRVVSGLTLDKDTKLRLMQELTHIIAGDFSAPPDCAHKMYTAICQLTDIDDPFAQIKKSSNALRMSLLPQLRAVCEHNPLEQALKISLAANIIDYGIGDSSCGEDFAVTLKTVIHNIYIPEEFYREFILAIEKAETIFYLADNAGKIVADMLLIDYLPKEKIVFVVRCYPVINDATVKDAKEIGLTQKVKVITTGDSTPGINLKRCSKEFLQKLSQADLVIVKEGNFETMIDVPLDGFAKKGVKLFFCLK